MSSEILMKRKGYNLVPFDAVAEADMEEMPEGPFFVTIRKPRSLPHNRLYFACLGAMEKAGAPGNREDLHNATKMKCGLVRMCVMPGGDFMAFPDSTAFNAMDQLQFNMFFERAVEFWKSSRLWSYLPADLRAKLDAGERLAA